jgi:cytochrome c peroxidase
VKLKFIIICSFCFIAIAFRYAKEVFFVVPKNWPQPVYDFSKNPLTANKIELGRALFYDPILSRNNMISCASCHSQYNAFTHADHALSHGIEDKIGTRNSPALMNLAWQTLFMQDGAVNHLDVQALAPITHPNEMGEDINHMIEKLNASSIYPALFYKAYNDSNISSAKTLKAISQFLLTLVSHNAKYDSVMRKQASFTEQENKGYVLFKKNCATCHTEPLFTNYEFVNNGLVIDTTLNDLGRFKITQYHNDSFKFKTPTLRNIEFSYPYMHDGRFKNLQQVLNHYTNGINHSSTLSPKLKGGIPLSSNEKVDIIAFLLTLTDQSFLFSKNSSYPKHILLNASKD